MKRFISLFDERGFTLPQILITAALLGSIAVIAVPALIGKSDPAKNHQAQVSVAKTVSSLNQEVLFNNSVFPSYDQMVQYLKLPNGDLTFKDHSEGAASQGPFEVTIERESDYQASFCAKSETGLVYCARQNSLGHLQVDENVAYRNFEHAPPLFGGEAWAKAPMKNSDTHSLCVGVTETAARNCLAQEHRPPVQSGAAVPDWNAVPAGGEDDAPNPDVDPDPEPEPEPEPEPLDYQAYVNSLGPNAQCPFDESGDAYVNLQCQNINGQYQPTSPVFTLQNPGAILSDPSSKSVRFNGTTHYSYGNPTGGSTNNQGASWSATVWVKFNNASTHTGIISADDNWAFQSSGASGFTCSMRLGNPWSVRQVTGGPTHTAGDWYFLGCTYHNGVLTLFVNGVQVASTSGVPSGQSGNGNFRPGYVSSGWTGGSYLNGHLDQFNFFKKVLSPEDIAEMYRQAGY